MCLLFVGLIFARLSKAIFYAFRPSSKSLGSLPSLGSFPKRARAARCWPECGACLLHSINMPSSRSLFNQKSEFLKVDLPSLEDILTSFHATKMLSK